MRYETRKGWLSLSTLRQRRLLPFNCIYIRDDVGAFVVKLGILVAKYWISRITDLVLFGRIISKKQDRHARLETDICRLAYSLPKSIENCRRRCIYKPKISSTYLQAFNVKRGQSLNSTVLLLIECVHIVNGNAKRGQGNGIRSHTT